MNNHPLHDDGPILIDCDGVLIDHNAAFLQRVNKALGTDFSFEEIHCFDYAECLGPSAKALIYEYWQADDLYDGLSPEPGALAALTELRKLRRVCVVSTPFVGHIKSKYRWLSRFFEPNDIYICHDKSLLKGCLLIDDAPHNLAASAWPWPAIVFDRPWNRDVNGIPRAKDWIDVVRLAKHTLREGG